MVILGCAAVIARSFIPYWAPYLLFGRKVPNHLWEKMVNIQFLRMGFKHFQSCLCTAAMACILTTSAFAVAQPLPSADAFIQEGLKTIALLDAGGLPEVWKNASPVFQQNISIGAFSLELEKTRKGVAIEGNRNWVAISRVFHAAGNTARVPPGIYVNINYVVSLRGGSTLAELLSFRLEPDAQWRLAGYAAKQAP